MASDNVLKTLKIISLLTFLLLISPELASQISTNGFFRNYNALLTSGPNEYLVGRNRFNLDMEIGLTSGRVFISNRVINTYTRSTHFYTYDFTEGYIDLYYDAFDLKIGKQIITQGRADGTFITDILSPIDLSEFLTQEVEDIKIGIPAVKLNRYYNSNFLELVVSPIFQSNTFDEPEGRWFPFAQLERAGNVVYADSSSETTKKQIQGMIKWAFREDIKWDLDLMLLYWTESSPALVKDLTSIGSGLAQEPALLLSKQYNTTPILGYSGNYILNDTWILKSESAFYFSKQLDYLPLGLQSRKLGSLNPTEQQELSLLFAQNDDGFLLKRPWLVSMIGLQTEIMGAMVSTQFINEHIFDYRSDILKKQDYYYSTLLVQKNVMRDKLTLYTFGRYNYIGKDFWVNPKISYELAGAVESTLGFHFFYGNDTEAYYGHFSFRDYRSNSFGYLKVTAYF